MQHRSTLIVVAALSLLGVACGSSSGTAATTTPTSAPATSAAPDTTAASTTVATTGASTGSDSQTADGKAFVAAIMSQPSQDSGFTTDQRQCISEAVVDSIGLQALQAAGVTPESVTADTDPNSPIPNFTITDSMADGIVTGMFKCADMGAFFVDAMSSGGTAPLAPAKKQCLATALSASPDLHDLLKLQLTGGDSTAAQTSLQNAVLPMAVACKITTSELVTAFGS
jgi:hypothetical protein